MSGGVFFRRLGRGWDAIRAHFFEPCRTAQRGRPWEDVA